MANNVINAVFSSSNITYTKPAYQYDYGMILKFSGIELPQAYEVHFSNTEFCGESISQIGDENGVTIPDEMFLSGAPIYAWTFLHTGEDDGETVYKTVISINKRAQPSNLEPTPVQQDVITQAIAALNVAVEQTAQDVVDATAAKDAAETAQGLAESARDTAETAQGRAEDAQEAAETAQREAELAQEAAETAESHAQGYAQTASDKASEASGYASDAQGFADSASSSASDAQDYANDAKEYSESASASASDASGYASSAYESAQSASGSASDASSAKDLAVQAKDDAISAKDDAVSAKDDAVSAKDDAISAKEYAEGFASDASDSASEAQGYASDAQTSAEQAQESAEYVETALIDKADVITSTASGEIVTIADGGKDMPVVDLSVSLLPVQSGSGDPSPDNVRPISGWTGVDVKHTGRNLLDFAVNSGSGITATKENGIAKISGTATALTYPIDFVEIKLKPGKYTFIIDGLTTGISASYTKNGSWGGGISGSTTFTLNSETLVGGYVYVSNGTDVGTNREIRVMLEKGETAHGFEPFGQVYPISWQSEAGTVYGGSLDLTNGKLTVTHENIDLGDLYWNAESNNVFWANLTGAVANTGTGNIPDIYCSIYKKIAAMTFTNWGQTTQDKVVSLGYDSARVYIRDSAYSDVDTFSNAMDGMQLVYPLATKIEYTLTETQIATFLGTNNFWSNSNGQIDLEYRCDTKLYIEQLTKPSEDDMVANQNITSGAFFMVGNRLFQSTVAIAQGETIIPGTNCTEVSLADALNQINA